MSDCVRARLLDGPSVAWLRECGTMLSGNGCGMPRNGGGREGRRTVAGVSGRGCGVCRYRGQGQVHGCSVHASIESCRVIPVQGEQGYVVEAPPVIHIPACHPQRYQQGCGAAAITREPAEAGSLSKSNTSRISAQHHRCNGKSFQCPSNVPVLMTITLCGLLLCSVVLVPDNLDALHGMCKPERRFVLVFAEMIMRTLSIGLIG